MSTGRFDDRDEPRRIVWGTRVAGYGAGPFFSTKGIQDMGGPACGLWVPLGTRLATEAAVDWMIRAVEACDRAPDDGFANDPRGRRARRRRLAAQAPRVGPFSTQDTRVIGGRLVDCSTCFYCTPDDYWGSDHWRDEVAEVEVLDGFGFQPDPVCWSISASVNSDDAHRALAVFAAHLAERTGGVIDFGTLLPVTIELPGVVHTAGGYTGRMRRTLLDAVAMRAWAMRPDCWMV